MTVCEITRPIDGFAGIFGTGRGNSPGADSPVGTHLVYSCKQIDCVFWLNLDAPYLLMCSNYRDEYVSGTRKVLGYETIESSPYSGEDYSPIVVAMDMREHDFDLSHYFDVIPGSSKYNEYLLSVGKLLASRCGDSNAMLVICKSYGLLSPTDTADDTPFAPVSEDSLLYADSTTGLFVN